MPSFVIPGTCGPVYLNGILTFSFIICLMNGLDKRMCTAHVKPLLLTSYMSVPQNHPKNKKIASFLSPDETLVFHLLVNNTLGPKCSSYHGYTKVVPEIELSIKYSLIVPLPTHVIIVKLMDCKKNSTYFSTVQAWLK